MNHASSSNVPTVNVYDGGFDEILRLLNNVYWGGLEREIRELVLAYQEIENHHDHPTSDERGDVDFGACNLRKFCTLLSKYTMKLSKGGDGNSR
jgi:hypothetical protein